ncbi:MAG TPA: NAD(P)/FAD-dependent oxidoreductase [Edaphobacter sp.]|nr:NAD(P)/FAD-dependent oxidoreductase [Edaphobacter sp.]
MSFLFVIPQRSGGICFYPSTTPATPKNPSVNHPSSVCHFLVNTIPIPPIRRHIRWHALFSMHPGTIQSDVFIVGAGPAGLACAIASARQGLDVQVVDAARPPIDKACGEGLLPGSLESLAALGFDLARDLDETESAPLHGVRFLGDSSAPDSYPIIQCPFPAGPGRGIRRTALHPLLFDRAASLGVRFHWESSVRRIEIGKTTATIQTASRPETRAGSRTFRTRYLIGADGHQSRIAKWAGLTAGSVRSRRIGLRQHYAIAPWSSFVEIYWSNHGQAYVTPISSCEICVAFVSREKIGSAEQALRHFPALQRHLLLAKPSGPPRGSITLGRTLHRVVSGNIALIGDASGSVDAITGEGLALGFRQAVALASALKKDNLTAYQRDHRRIQRLPTLMSRSLLLMDRSPRVRDRALNLFERNPSLFARLLQIHIGHAPQRPFAVDPRYNPTTPEPLTSSIPG